MDELDVLVVGGYFGKGHRASLLSHFLCAVAVPEADGGKPKRFHSFCRVSIHCIYFISYQDFAISIYLTLMNFITLMF